MKISSIALLLCAFCSHSEGFLFNSIGGALRHSLMAPKGRSNACESLRMSVGDKKILILGGTGFVGSEILRCALTRGYKVVAISRRGYSSSVSGDVDWRKGDVSDPDTVQSILDEGGFSAVVHAVGILFEGDINKYASGSGSVPSPGSTYDVVTRQTAMNAIRALRSIAKENENVPFAFISAAEAKWTIDRSFQGTPLEWLRRYLVAKRAVEDALLKDASDSKLRPIIVRPSLVWTWDKPGALLPVAAFTLGNQVGLPGVDRPVNVQLLARAVLSAIETPAERGVFDYAGMERLAARIA